MKKLFLIPFFCLLFLGCVSTDTDDKFVQSYNEVLGVQSVKHKDLEPGMIYNLRDSITGERAHLMFQQRNGKPVITLLYQSSKWAFFDYAVFLADGERLEVPFESRTSNVIGPFMLEEVFSGFIAPEAVEKLKTMLASDSCSVAFVGDKVSDKMPIKPKVRAALLEVLAL